MRGLIGQTLDWLVHPSNSDAQVSDWLAFTAVVLIAAYLWHSQVIQKLTE